jgi:SAM-dependent methyltransferase
LSVQRSSAPVWALRRAARWGVELCRGTALDVVEALAGRRRPLTPPRRLWHLIGSPFMDFHKSGEDFRDFLVANGLKPDHRVLDVGCGLGRLAIALTDYLGPDGAYEGFDIMPAAIRWCRRITAAHPNFRFQLVDLHSDRYHRSGGGQASRFVFPYPDASFDYVTLASVFTHLMPADMRNYLAEIARVLKPGGRCSISWFLLTPEVRVALQAGNSLYSFSHAGEGYWAEDAQLPEAAIAFDQAEVLALYDALGFDIVGHFPGLWPRERLTSQDIVIAAKRGQNIVG